MLISRNVPRTTCDIPLPLAPSAPRCRRTGQVELLLQCVEKMSGRGLSGYESRLLLTIVESIVAEAQRSDGTPE